MGDCGSSYFQELPDIVYNLKHGTDEREFIMRKLSKQERENHKKVMKIFQNTHAKAKNSLENFLLGNLEETVHNEEAEQ